MKIVNKIKSKERKDKIIEHKNEIDAALVELETLIFRDGEKYSTPDRISELKKIAQNYKEYSEILVTRIESLGI